MQKTISPIDNKVYIEREYHSGKIEETLNNSVKAQNSWSHLSVKERVELLQKFVEDFSYLKEEERPKTKSSGLSEYNKIHNSIIIEESNYGRVFEYDLDTGEIVWSFLNTGDEKKNFWRMSWSRLYLENPIKFN